MVRLLLVKERVMSGFNASRTVTSKTGIPVEERRFFEDAEWRHYLSKLVSKSRRIGMITENGSISHFKTPQSHGNDSEARKLGDERIEAEKC